MNRLVLISNRLPITIRKENGRFQYFPSSGGLATGLSSYHQKGKSIWLGWSGIHEESISEPEKAELAKTLREEYSNVPLYFSRELLDKFYYGFCNKTIWPLFHYFTQYVCYENEYWDAYKEANEKFYEKLDNILKPDDTVWVHDYHLMLLPKMIRDKMPSVKIGFFLHIPFPSYELFRLLPWKEELLNGLLGADLIGFHTYDYVRHFLSSVLRILGHEHSFGNIRYGDRIVKVDEFPMGIDYDKFSEAYKDENVKKEMENIRREVGDKKIILSVDRLDYTKGIPVRLRGFEHFLDNNEEYREKVTLIMVSVPSRTQVDSYQELKTEVDTLVGRINGKFSTLNWIPVWYLFHTVPFERLAALYTMADVGLVTPLRDGMNLVAKEYIASQKEKGVLILSDMAGATQELGEAILLTPTREEEISQAILDALRMDEKTQKRGLANMQNRLRRYTVTKWAKTFIEKLTHSEKEKKEDIAALKVDHKIEEAFLESYSVAESRLFLLDYDGTLISFEKQPEDAVPTERVLNLLNKLNSNPKNDVIIISGRDKDTLGEWFKDYPDFVIIAEHGVWIREKREDWQLLEEIDDEWKEEIRPILERYHDITPGSLVEEKSFSLAWHYRKAAPEFGGMRAKELKENLLYLTRNLDIGVLEGNKVIEVKSKNINKGKAVRDILDRAHWEFIFAAGDDWTDEDTFAVLPEYATSVKVRYDNTKARYTVKSCEELVALLEKFANTD